MARILVVDHDPLVARGLARLLELDGHEVVASSSCTEAIACLRGRDGRFDAVITDGGKGESGADVGAVARAARERSSRTCVFVCTVREHLPDLPGACVVVPKPIVYDALHAHILACRTCDTCAHAEDCAAPDGKLPRHVGDWAPRKH